MIKALAGILALVPTFRQKFVSWPRERREIALHVLGNMGLLFLFVRLHPDSPDAALARHHAKEAGRLLSVHLRETRWERSHLFGWGALTVGIVVSGCLFFGAFVGVLVFPWLQFARTGDAAWVEIGGRWMATVVFGTLGGSAARYLSAVGFFSKDRVLASSEKIFGLCHVLPSRFTNEELGDASERLHKMAAAGAPPTQLRVAIFVTFAFVWVGALRALLSPFTPKK